LTRPWFTRVLVFQELIFSRDSWLQFGKLRAKWYKVHDAVESSTTSNPFDKPWAYLLDMGADKRRLASSNNSQDRTFCNAILGTLDARRGLAVSDPRDMLFAHRAILGKADGTEQERSLIKVDYGKGCAEVYADVAKYVSQIGQTCTPKSSYEIFSYAELSTELTGRPWNIPTWAPNWILKCLPHSCRRLREVMKLKSKKYWTGMPSPGFNYSVLVVSEWVPSIRHLWIGSSIFASVGFRVGKLRKISEVITEAQSMWKLREHIEEDLGVESFQFIERKIKVLLFSHWKGIISLSCMRTCRRWLILQQGTFS